MENKEVKTKKFDGKVEDNVLHLAADTNQDGEPSVALKIKMNEAVQELMKKGGKLEGAKLLALGFQDGKMILKVDTDQDGEEVLDLEVSLMEVVDELGFFS